jgi:type I restriction enzyme S subunit
MVEWKEVKIGSLGEVITGNTPLTSDREFYGGSYPFIKPTDMEIDRRYVSKWEENYSEKAFKKYKNAYIPKGATGVVTIGTVGEKLFQADKPCFTNQSVNVVIPNQDLYDNDFIYYLLKYNLPKVKNANPGTASGRHHVSKSNFCSISVTLTTNKKVQKKIASILSAYDDLIENNLKRIKLLEELAQKTYEEWFVKFTINGEKLSINEETGLPDGWERKTLKEVAHLIKDSVLPENLLPNTPYIGLEHIPRKSITLAIWETADKVESLKYVFKKGDILFGKIRPYFHKVGIAIIDGISSSDTIILRAKIKSYQGIILQTVFSDLFVNTATQSSNGTKMPRANWDVLKEYPVIIPDFYNLEIYDRFTTRIINCIENLCKQNQLLKEARDILLPRLMNRTIEVKETSNISEFMELAIK